MDLNIISSQETLDKISRHCPDALTAYLHCYNRADSKGMIFFSKEMVEVNMSDVWRSFLNKIKKLAREGLLEWHPFEDGIAVTLADAHEYD